MPKTKLLFIGFLICCSCHAHGQQDETKIPIPMLNSMVFYEQVYKPSKPISKKILFNKALHWLKTSFPDSLMNLKNSDEKTGMIRAVVRFRVNTSESGNYFWLRPAITIQVSEDSCRFEASDYYEKPVEKGVSNDYSKIEYRWRDFKRGKPWSPEDQKLFEGLDQGTRKLMQGLGNAIGN